MALAVVEYVVGASAAAFADNGASAAWFRGRVTSAVADFLPDLKVAGSSGFEVAQAVRRSPNPAGLFRALFDRLDAAHRLRADDALRDAVMGKTAVDLYRMNRRGRLDAGLSAAQHVGLMELVNDNVECIYLHFRDNWIHILTPRVAT